MVPQNGGMCFIEKERDYLLIYGEREWNIGAPRREWERTAEAESWKKRKEILSIIAKREERDESPVWLKEMKAMVLCHYLSMELHIRASSCKNYQ